MLPVVRRQSAQSRRPRPALERSVVSVTHCVSQPMTTAEGLFPSLETCFLVMSTPIKCSSDTPSRLALPHVAGAVLAASRNHTAFDLGTKTRPPANVDRPAPSRTQRCIEQQCDEVRGRCQSDVRRARLSRLRCHGAVAVVMGRAGGENRAVPGTDIESAYSRHGREVAGKIGARVLRTPRSAGIAGIAFSLLFTVTFVCTRLVVSADPSEAGSWLRDPTKRDVARLGLLLAPFAGIAFLWFIGVVRSRIGEAEDRFFATVFLGSGLLFIALFLASIAITEGLADSAGGDAQRLADSGILTAGRHISEATLEAALVMAGVFTTATSTILLRTGVGPRWLDLVGSVVAIVMVLDGQRVEPWVVLAFPACVFALSLYILVSSRRDSVPELI